ncbi:hypothetical protein [Deinococcus ruber]|uniref:Uncharacterized protein n=1 Tax=Deinococcus ruber TaxID=1848197 RepID=A0A918CQG1_9DEIO|nr:hypothetical protein [Deinococcus ruber]GGR33468.1 hypothetical protein GCM10008957_49700 [Deinococcus ruber]
MAAALLPGPALAQSAPATEAQVCAADENLLELHIGSTTRGTFVTRLVGTEVWLDPKALRPEETAYFDTEVHCGQDWSVRLLPRFAPTIDSERLTLSFQPAPQVLAGQSVTVTEPVTPPAETIPLFSLDYVAAVSGSLSTLPSVRGGLRARYVNGPLNASVGAAAEVKADGGRWVPSAQVGVTLSPTSSVQLAYNVGYTGDVASSALSSLNSSRFTGAHFQLSNTPLQLWPALTIELPFQAHLRVRIDGLLLTEYDVAAGPVTLRDLPLHHRQGRIEVEIRDETGTRTIVQDYDVPGITAGSANFSVDAGLLDSSAYVSAQGQYALTPLVNVEGSGRMVGTAFQAQVRTVVAPDDTRAFSVGMTYNSARTQPFSAVGSAWMVAAPFTVTAFAAMPIGDLSQTTFSTSLAYTARRYDVQWKVSAARGLSDLSTTLQGNVRVLPELTLSPAVTVRRGGVQVGLALDFHPGNGLSVTGRAGSGGTSASLNAQYRLNPSTQIGLSASPGGAALKLQYADSVRVDAALDTHGIFNVAAQGSAYLMPGGVQFSQGNPYGAFVLVETGQPAVQVFADGRLRGVTDATGRLVFSMTPGRAVSIRVDADSLPFDVTLKSDVAVLNLPGPGSYRLDWRNNFVHSRFVTFHWADGSVAANAEIRFENDEINYTDTLGTGFLLVSPQDRRATLTSQDGKQRCAVTVPAHAEAVTCDPGAP